MAEKEVKVVVSGDSVGAEAALKRAGKAASDFGNEADKAGERAKDGLDKAREGAQKAAQGIGGLNTALEGLKAAAALGTVGAIVKGIASMGTTAVMAAAKMKQYEIAFSTMLKSADKGKAMLKDLQDFAAKTPFDVPGVVETAQQLTAFGFEAKSIIPTLTVLGDAAAALGKGSEGVKLMGYALGQIKASGTLKTQDVNQLTNAGIGVWQMLAEASGKSVAEIRDMTEKGMIDSLTAIEIITKGMQTNYGGMMEATGQEVVGLVSNINESIGNGVALVGSYITEAFGIKDILKSISDSIGSMSDAFRTAKEAGKSFGEALISAVPTPVLIAIGAFVSIIGGALVAAIGAAVAALGALLAPVAGTIVAIAAIGTGIAALLSVSETARDAVSAAFDGIKTVINTVIDVIGDLKDIFTDSSKSLGDCYLEAVGYVTGLFYRLADNILDAMKNAIAAVANFASEAIDSFIEVVTGGANMGDDLVTIMSNAAERAVVAVLSWFASLPEKIAGIIKSIKAGFSLSADGNGISIQGVASGDRSDFAALQGDNASAKTETASKAPVNLSGNGSATKAAGGRGGGGLDRTEREVSRINEAVASAKTATTDLQSKFDNLGLEIAFEGTSGSERVFAEIDREKTARLNGIKDNLAAQANALNEAQKLRESAEKTGNATAIAAAQELYAERNAMYLSSLEDAETMRAAIEQQAAEKSITLQTQLLAAKQEAERAMQELRWEEFITYLDSEEAEQYARLQTEQELRQQMFDWQMESQQTLLDFAIMAANTMKNQLASGIAAVVTKGQSFGKMLANLGKQILSMFIQWGVGRALASAMNKLFAKKDSATLASQAAADTTALTAPAILNESLHPGSIARATLTVGGVTAASAAASSLGGLGGDSGGSGLGGDGLTTSIGGTTLSGSMIGASSTNAFADSGGIIASNAGGINVVNNNYGAITTGADLDDLFGGFSSAVLSATRGG